MQYQFLDFTLDTEARALRRAARALHISPKAFDVLSLLVRERQRVVTREELYDYVWPNTFVVDGNLPVLVREIRSAIDDRDHDVITTIHRKGYRFAAHAREIGAAIDSVAIMPLVNKSGDTSLDYLADGITDHIINRLTLVPGLRVMSRNATFRYKGGDADARQIGRDLSVASVMLGSLTRMGGDTAVTIELVDASDQRVILSRTYVRADAELVSLPLRVAADVAEHLLTQIDPAVRAIILKEPTANPDAYRFYLHARDRLSHFDPINLKESIDWNERAVAADPNFSAAYSDLSRAYLQLAVYFAPPREIMPLALKNVRRALDIDPTLADAHINLGVIHFMYEWNWEAAERELLVMNELPPRTAEAFSCASHVLESAGRNVNAEQFIRRGLAADPHSTPLRTELGCNSYAHRRYDDAIVELRDALALDPRNPVAYWGLGRCYGQKEMFAEALEELRKVERMFGFNPPIIASEIGYVFGRLGNDKVAQATLDTLFEQRQKVFIDPYLIAIVYLGMNRHDDALTWLERACEEKSSFAVAIIGEPKWDPVRDEPRFMNALDEIFH